MNAGQNISSNRIVMMENVIKLEHLKTNAKIFCLPLVIGCSQKLLPIYSVKQYVSQIKISDSKCKKTRLQDVFWHFLI